MGREIWTALGWIGRGSLWSRGREEGLNTTKVFGLGGGGGKGEGGGGCLWHDPSHCYVIIRFTFCQYYDI